MNDKNLKLLFEIEKDLKHGGIDSEKFEKFLTQTKKTLKRYGKILALSDSQQFELLRLKEKLEHTNFLLKLLLDNADEGFLYVNGDLKIEPVYSKKVNEIFSGEIKGKYIYEVLFSQNPLFYKETLEDILNSDFLKAEILISLLPKEKIINGKYIQIEYKKLSTESFMVILRDVTEKRNLEISAEEEKEKLKMIVEVVSSPEQFLEIMFEYEDFASKITEFTDKSFLKMKLHTFKGLFAQKHMKNVVKTIHEIEKHLNGSENIILNREVLLNPVSEDIASIKEILGEDFFERFNSKTINKKRLKEIYFEAKKTGAEARLSDSIKELMYFNVNEFIKPFKSLINELAQRYNKQVEFCYECDLFLPDIYKPFFMSLVHVFRNSVYHGIEEEYERIQSGKNEKGFVFFKAEKKGNEITVVIEDDGRGVDIKKISEKTGKKITENEIEDFIFKNGFSTNDKIDFVSGRGVGLYSVYEEVRNLGGEINVLSAEGKGVKFLISLPYIQDDNAEIILEEIGEEIKRYFSQSGYISEKVQYFVDYKPKSFSAFINLSGDVEKTLFIHLDSKALKAAAKRFIHGTEDEDMLKEHYGDIIKEIINILAGRVIKKLKKYGINIQISIPFEYSGGINAYVKELNFTDFGLKTGIGEKNG